MEQTNWPFKRAIVTGGAGFIGSHIVDALVERGVHAISLDNYSSGSRINLAHLQGNPLFQEIDCDIRNQEALAFYLDGVDIIFHNACAKKVACNADPFLDLDVNAKGTLCLLEVAVAKHVRKFVHASTGSVYGQPVKWPQDENHPTNPTTFYGVSKLAGEKYVQLFHDQYGLDTTILRYFHVYGPRQEDTGAGVVSIFIKRLLEGKPPVIYGDGSQQRCFTYVKDVVDANLHVAVTPRCSGRVYNCACEGSVTVKALALVLQKLTHTEHLEPIHEGWQSGEVKQFDVDCSKLQYVGYHCATLRADGLAFTVGYLQGKVDGEA